MARAFSRLVAGPLLAAAFAAPALAAEAQAATEAQPGWSQELDNSIRAAEDAVEGAARALGAFLESLPRYGAPEVQDNGDIVIPRLNPPQERADGAQPRETGDARSI